MKNGIKAKEMEKKKCNWGPQTQNLLHEKLTNKK